MLDDIRILFYDTETTGLPIRNLPVDAPGQPHITELGAILDINGREAMVLDTLIYPDKWPFRKDKMGKPTDRLIDPIASEMTGITEEMCYASGIPIIDAVEAYMIMATQADIIVCHNTDFDGPQMEMEFSRVRSDPSQKSGMVHCGRPLFCTMKKLTPVLKLPKKDGRAGNKWPKLEEAYLYFFKKPMEKAHSAIHDIRNTRDVFYECVKLGLFDREIAAIHASRKNA